MSYARRNDPQGKFDYGLYTISDYCSVLRWDLFIEAMKDRFHCKPAP